MVEELDPKWGSEVLFVCLFGLGAWGTNNIIIGVVSAAVLVTNI
jgi:hypothetical protein